MGPSMSAKKEMISFRLDHESLDELNEYCEENCVNRSALLSKLVREFLSEVNSEED